MSYQAIKDEATNNNGGYQGAEDQKVLYQSSQNDEFDFEPCSFAFQTINYTITTKTRKQTTSRQILKDINGLVLPGETLAIMGPSGGGKTTLLNILAQRRMKSKELEGNILVNGRKVQGKRSKKLFKRRSGYVMQDDCLIGELTVRETLISYARLRLPQSMSNAEKLKRVDKAIEVLGISHIANTKIGNPESRGISGGERKRVSIAVELISSPPLIFLDEPTTGLDGKNASSVVSTLMSLKKRKHCIILTIHQPRAHIFNQFDKLLLLSKGRVAYFGPANKAVDYFQSLGFQAPNHENPADFIVDVVTADPSDPVKTKQVDDILDKYENSEMFINLLDKLKTLPEVASRPDEGSSKDLASRGSVNFKAAMGGEKMIEKASPLGQFIELTRRNTLVQGRNYWNFLGKIASAVGAALISGTCFWQLGKDQDEVQERVNVINFIALFCTLSSLISLPQLINERLLYVRERANGTYGPSPYFLAYTISNFPQTAAFISTYVLIVIFCVHLDFAWDKVLFVWMVSILTTFGLESICVLASSVAKTYEQGQAMASFFLSLGNYFNGFTVAYDDIVIVWKWVYWMSFQQYCFTALMINEFDGKTFDCPEPPEPCQYPTGQSVLESLDIDNRNKWDSVWAIGLLIFGFRLATYLILKFFTKQRN
eukprot:CAMPEP_0168578606 /NCGR_PEP_ID=MMETSP0413-20121227/21424_1 /TAXON_ID=136452 /ORGANISM="Filamoeba nolandi, Strain NC-AS-23-1" /LENGTH=655 /DNA_ID=CAMNT_0008612467 /DNA_START=81 /DNA_END=2048 /DNA_ORIENTATION=+